MFETLVSFNMIEHLSGETFCPAVGSMGYDRVLSPHRRPYRTKDGYLGLMPYNTTQWQRFFEIAGKPQYAADVRFIEHAARSENIDELYRILAEILVSARLPNGSDCSKPLIFRWRPCYRPKVCSKTSIYRPWDSFAVTLIRLKERSEPFRAPFASAYILATIERLAPRLDEHREEILKEMTGSVESNAP